jgi:pimeloyl-ACP methyl ester carboxylesterase
VANVPLPVPIDIGAGPVVVLLPGFALPPRLYLRTARLLAARVRVVVPELYRLDAGWHYDDVVARLALTVDSLDVPRVTLIGHSFAGSVELGYATEHPQRIVELVFADTLAVSREWPLAEEAARHPLRLLWLATPSVATGFTHTVVTHPREVVQAAWFGFKSGRTDAAKRVAQLGLRAHVLWASRDSLLSRSDGQAFARDMHASFTVANPGRAHVVDHDWMYRHPHLFVHHLDQLGLEALSGAGA